jgi:hypothetical protein
MHDKKEEKLSARGIPANHARRDEASERAAVEEERVCGSPLLMLVHQVVQPPYKEVQLSPN